MTQIVDSHTHTIELVSHVPRVSLWSSLLAAAEALRKARKRRRHSSEARFAVPRMTNTTFHSLTTPCTSSITFIYSLSISMNHSGTGTEDNEMQFECSIASAAAHCVSKLDCFQEPGLLRIGCMGRSKLRQYTEVRASSLLFQLFRSSLIADRKGNWRVTRCQGGQAPMDPVATSVGVRAAWH